MNKAIFILGILFAVQACTDNQVKEVHPGIYVLDNKQAIETFEELNLSMD